MRRREPTLLLLMELAAIATAIMLVRLVLALAVTSAGWAAVGIGALILFAAPIPVAMGGGRNASTRQARPAGYATLLSFVLALIQRPDRQRSHRR